MKIKNKKMEEKSNKITDRKKCSIDLLNNKSSKNIKPQKVYNKNKLMNCVHDNFNGQNKKKDIKILQKSNSCCRCKLNNSNQKINNIVNYNGIPTKENRKISEKKIKLKYENRKFNIHSYKYIDIIPNKFYNENYDYLIKNNSSIKNKKFYEKRKKIYKEMYCNILNNKDKLKLINSKNNNIIFDVNYKDIIKNIDKSENKIEDEKYYYDMSKFGKYYMENDSINKGNECQNKLKLKIDNEILNKNKQNIKNNNQKFKKDLKITNIKTEREDTKIYKKKLINHHNFKSQKKIHKKNEIKSNKNINNNLINNQNNNNLINNENNNKLINNKSDNNLINNINNNSLTNDLNNSIIIDNIDKKKYEFISRNEKHINNNINAEEIGNKKEFINKEYITIKKEDKIINEENMKNENNSIEIQNNEKRDYINNFNNENLYLTNSEVEMSKNEDNEINNTNNDEIKNEINIDNSKFNNLDNNDINNTYKLTNTNYHNYINNNEINSNKYKIDDLNYNNNINVMVENQGKKFQYIKDYEENIININPIDENKDNIDKNCINPLYISINKEEF